MSNIHLIITPNKIEKQKTIICNHSNTKFIHTKKTIHTGNIL